MKVDENIIKIMNLNRPDFGDEIIHNALEKYKSIPKSIGSFKKEDVFVAILYQTIKEMKDPFITVNDINHISNNKQTLKKAVKTIVKLFGNNPLDYSEYVGINLNELKQHFATDHPRTLAIIGLYLKGYSHREIEQITHSSYCHVRVILKKFLGDANGLYHNTEKCEKETLDVGLATS